MFVVDTNVLVYAADENAPEHHGIRRICSRTDFRPAERG
jgi:predicted nucleic acid-binding protein